MSRFAVQPLGTAQEVPIAPEVVRVPEDTWEFDQGWGWVYRAPGHDQLLQPIIMSDGFHLGETDRDSLYLGLNDPEGYPLVDELNQRGYDVILLGYRDCTASIYENSRAAEACIMRANAEKLTDTPLVVGGFSMGGLITRHALLRLERMRMRHQTSHYFSYDSPHNGAWIPISLQCFAWYTAPANGTLLSMVNSDAAKQMLWRHKKSLAAEAEEHQDRRDFAARLAQMGDWPSLPMLIGLANGRGDGQGNGFPPGELAMKVTEGMYAGTELFLQASQAVGPEGAIVARLRTLNGWATTKRTNGYPELDSAAGGTLDSFGIVARMLNATPGQGAEAPWPDVDFVPTISALGVADTDIGSGRDLKLDIGSLPEARFPFDHYQASPNNTGHTEITRELCEYLLQQIADK
jgi:pimeloyl-ACP methyl ester carboxylesterase